MNSEKVKTLEIMSESWTDYPGDAIAISPYISNGKNQISFLTGDQFQVFHRNDQWIHVKNIFSGAEGIIPLACVEFTDNINNFGPQNFYGWKSDFLLYEAKVTIRYTLNVLRTANPDLTLEFTSLLGIIIDGIESFEIKTLPVDQFFSTRKKISEAIDAIREKVGLSKLSRSPTLSMNTVTTTSREQFQRTFNRSRSREQEYIIFHILLAADQLKKPINIRAFIVDKMRGDLSTSISANLSPTQPTANLVFDQFERRDMKNTFYLVIYSIDAQTHEIFSCAITDLPSCRQEAQYGKSHELRFSSVQTDSNSYINCLHQYLTFSSSNSSFKPIYNSPPFFNAVFTCEYGPTHKIIKKESFYNSVIVPPLRLPSTFSPKLIRSIVNVCYTVLDFHEKQKKIRLTTRLLDNNKHCFIHGLENPETRNLDAETWRSPILRADKHMNIHDSFQIDIRSLGGDLTDKYVVLEVERVAGDDKFVPILYAMIPLANESGAAISNLDNVLLGKLDKTAEPGKVSNYQLPIKADKEGGSVEFVLTFSSNKVTTDLPLYKLLNWRKFEGDLRETLSEFMNCGICEWSKFVYGILSSLCEIIAVRQDLSSIAYQQLQSIMGDILNKNEYMPILEKFIVTAFEPSTCTDQATYEKLCLSIFPLVYEMMGRDRMSTEFRTFIKCLPHILQLSMRSYALHHLNHNSKSPLFTQSLIHDSDEPLKVNSRKSRKTKKNPDNKQDETDELNKETDELNKETEETNKETEELNKETEEPNKETEEETNKETEEETNKETEELNKETEELNKETEEINQETDELNKESKEEINQEGEPAKNKKEDQHSKKREHKKVRPTPSILMDCQMMGGIELMVHNLFEFFCTLVSECPDSSDQQKKSKIFTNQSLILQHFSSMVDALLRAYPASGLVPYISRFLNSVRNVEGDRTQQVIDKNKLRVIISLSTTPIWTDPRAHGIQNQFKADLLQASHLKHCSDLFIQALASLFFSVRDEFALQFTDSIATLARENPSVREGCLRLLLQLAFQFPSQFPASSFIDLMNDARDFVPSAELLFVFMNFISQRLPQAKDPSLGKAPPEFDSLYERLFTTFLDVAGKAQEGSGLNPIDKELVRVVYPQNTNFEILNLNQGLTYQLIAPILECYILYSSPTIKEAYAKILLADLGAHGDCSHMQKPTLVGLYNVFHFKNFERLLSLFDLLNATSATEYTIRKREAGALFYIHARKLVQSFLDIERLPNSIANEDELGEAFNTIISSCLEVNEIGILSEMIGKLVELEESCKNYLEAGCAILTAQSLISEEPSNKGLLSKLDEDMKPAPDFMEFNNQHQKKYGRNLSRWEFKLEILSKAVAFFVQAKMEEYAMEPLSEMQRLCEQYCFSERMREIHMQEGMIFQAISGLDRAFSNFYYVGFYGGGFEKIAPTYYSGRTFVYRRSFFVQSKDMVFELQEKFKDALIDSKFPTEQQKTDENGMYIQLLPVSVANEGELKDEFFRNNMDLPKYVSQFKEVEKPRVFRYEKVTKDKEHEYCNEFAGIFLEQHFFITKDQLPYSTTRVVVDEEKNLSRKLSPLENAIICMNRKNDELRSNNFVFKRALKKIKKERIDPGSMSSFTMSLKGTVNAAVNGGNMMYTEAFLSDKYAEDNQSDGDKIMMLRRSFKEQVEQLEIGLGIHERLVSQSMEELHKQMMGEFVKMKEDLLPVISAITN